KVLYGGRGSAKSWSVGRALVWKAYCEPLRILVRAIFSFGQPMPFTGCCPTILSRWDWKASARSKRRRYSEAGSNFLFKGLRSNVSEIKSTEVIDIAWTEEAEQTSEESWKVLVPIRKKGSEVWATFNAREETLRI